MFLFNLKGEVVMGKGNKEVETLFIPKSAFSVYQINDLYTEFQNVLAKNEPITVSMESVESIDTLGLQLLVSLVKSATDKGLSFNCEGCNQSVEAFLGRAGIDKNIFKTN